MSTLTGANANFTLGIPGVFTIPQALQGFATDDAFATQSIKRAEVLMGVDGVLSGGFVYVAVVQTIALQADSPSCALFDQWDAAQQTLGDVVNASGTIILPSLSTKWNMVKGFLTDFKPMGDVKKLIGFRTFGITWEGLTVAPQ
jgi:hypothetical protein